MDAFINATKPGVTHYVKDLKQAAEWYRDVLGFEIGPHEYGSFVELHMQGQYVFHLALAQEGMAPHKEPVFWFSSNDIEQSYSALKAAGVELGPMSWYPDYSSFTFRDLDGNAVAVSQNFEMRVRTLEELQLIGFRVVCPEGNMYAAAIPEAAGELKQRLSEIPDVADPHLMIGVYKAGDTVAEEDGYWVCVRVERIGTIPDGMTSLRVPSQRYAVKWHYGLRSGIGDTYRKLHQLMDEAGLPYNTLAWQVELQRNWGKLPEAEIELDLYCTTE